MKPATKPSSGWDLRCPGEQTKRVHFVLGIYIREIAAYTIHGELAFHSDSQLDSVTNRWLCLLIPPDQFVEAEWEIFRCRQEQRASGGRKDREVEGRFHTESRRHCQGKGGQKNSTEQSNGASFPTENEKKPEENFSSRGDDR